MTDMVTLSSAASAALESSGKIASATPAANEVPFSGALKGAMEQMSALEQDATSKVDGLLRGSGVDVHAAMIATERSDMAFELTLAVRNKAVAAYEQLNAMQF